MCIAFACVPCMRHACVVHEPCVPIPRVERARLSVHLCWWCALKRHYPAPANELLCDSVVDLGWKLVLCTLRTLRRVRYIILFLFMDLSTPHRWRDHPSRTLRKYKYQSWYCSPEHTHQVLSGEYYVPVDQDNHSAAINARKPLSSPAGQGWQCMLLMFVTHTHTYVRQLPYTNSLTPFTRDFRDLQPHDFKILLQATPT